MNTNTNTNNRLAFIENILNALVSPNKAPATTNGEHHREWIDKVVGTANRSVITVIDGQKFGPCTGCGEYEHLGEMGQGLTVCQSCYAIQKDPDFCLECHWLEEHHDPECSQFRWSCSHCGETYGPTQTYCPPCDTY